MRVANSEDQTNLCVYDHSKGPSSVSDLKLNSRVEKHEQREDKSPTAWTICMQRRVNEIQRREYPEQSSASSDNSIRRDKGPYLASQLRVGENSTIQNEDSHQCSSTQESDLRPGSHLSQMRP